MIIKNNKLNLLLNIFFCYGLHLNSEVIVIFFTWPFMTYKVVRRNKLDINNIFFNFCLIKSCDFDLRDGVSESQFNQVLNIELDQFIKVWFAIRASNFFFPCKKRIVSFIASS